MICYQCEKQVNYLFDDSRCKDCTRMTPEEVMGTNTSSVEYNDMELLALKIVEEDYEPTNEEIMALAQYWLDNNEAP